jgi:hypothetical protein
MEEIENGFPPLASLLPADYRVDAEKIIAMIFRHQDKSPRVSDQRKAILNLWAAAVETSHPQPRKQLARSRCGYLLVRILYFAVFYVSTVVNHQCGASAGAILNLVRRLARLPIRLLPW